MVVDWLLDGDPAIRWQALRDLAPASAGSLANERARVAREGLGAKILAAQDDDGAWRRADAPAWLTTLFTLQLLRATRVDPRDAGVMSAIDRLETNLRWDDDPNEGWDLRPVATAKAFFDGEVEPCINGGVLALGGYFGHPSVRLARQLLDEQLPDGGWNCEAPPSHVSSFHTTICVLEGLLEYERAVGGDAEILEARRRGEAYLLDRALFRRRTTGEVADESFLEFGFPPRYRYDVLRALEYFCDANDAPDARMSDALRYVERKRDSEGRWILDRSSQEALTFPLDESVGEPSRWNTLRALRVLSWATL